MDSFRSYMLRKAYQNVAKNGDKLAAVEPLIDWDAFTPIIQPMYSNQGPMGGRPNTDPVVMVKLLVLQQWYGLSDPKTVLLLFASGKLVCMGAKSAELVDESVAKVYEVLDDYDLLFTE